MRIMQQFIWIRSTTQAFTRFLPFSICEMATGNPQRRTLTATRLFLAFIARAKALSLYDTGVEVHEKDSILTLITCDRSFDGQDGRLVIMAVEKSEPRKG